MAKCKQCGVDIKVVPGKVEKQFCSDAHRKAYKRAELKRYEATAAPSVDELRTNGSLTPDKSTADTVEQTNADSLVILYELVPGQKVYGRQAVCYTRYTEAWKTRPEPLSPDDLPKAFNRGKYLRPDGSEYQFDAIGQVFEDMSSRQDVA